MKQSFYNLCNFFKIYLAVSKTYQFPFFPLRLLSIIMSTFFPSYYFTPFTTLSLERDSC